MSDDLRQRYAETLITHQRMDIGSCRCGWGVAAGHIGHSHARHVVEALMVVRDEELEKAGAELHDYRNTITWHTTCHGCAAHLDQAVSETERAERAEAVVERVRSEIAAITAENDAYAVRHNPECGCEVIETTREVVERICEALGGEHRKTWRAGTWRVGRKVGRTLYLQSGSKPSDKDMLIGMLDTVDLAARAVYAVNELAAREAGSDA